MKTFKTYIKILFIFSLLCCISCSKADDIYFNEDGAQWLISQKTTYSKIELELINLINTHRESIAQNKLVLHNIVSAVSETHTNYMIDNGQISHDNFFHRKKVLMDNASARSVAENVAYGYRSAQGMLNGYLNSESHKKIIETPKFTHIGISTKVNSDNRNFNTIILITK